MTTRLALLVLATLLGGCATADFNYRPEAIRVSEPSLDSENTAFIGDILLRQGRFTEHASIFLSGTIEISWAYRLLPGYYLKQGEDRNTETYLPGGDDEAGAIRKAGLADPWQALIAYKKKNKLCVLTVFGFLECKTTSDFERRTKTVWTVDSFQQTLIYSGKIGDKINISYREFINNRARPAFNNEVEYDLSESNVIGYKGARIEILEATNELIRYRVLRNFNAASM